MNTWLIRNENEVRGRLQALAKHIRHQDSYPVQLRLEPYRDPRSLDQNALFHVWVGDFARHVFNEAKPTKIQLTGMKVSLQRHCYADTGWDFLIDRVVDPFTGEETIARRSTTDLKKGEMYDYMCWVQMRAADQGLILESRGEYWDLQQGETA